MTSERRKEIEDKAIRLHQKAEEYQLSNATFACDNILGIDLQETAAQRQGLIRKKNGERAQAIKRQDGRTMARLTTEINNLNNSLKRLHIFVEYFSATSKESARTLILDSQILIELPDQLRDQCQIKEGRYDVDELRELRRLMAHELGHLMLHLDKLRGTESVGQFDHLLSPGDTFGSALLGDQEDEEADYFRDKLLAFRHERREALRAQDAFPFIDGV